MELFPAIDLRDGKAVRLVQGDYNQMTVFSDRPEEVALIGCSRPAAAEFSFFLGIPVMFGASFLKIVKFFIQGGGFSFAEFIYLVLGMVVAFGVSVYSIKFLMGYVRKHDFKFFGYYRIVLGIVVLSYFGISALVG